MLFVLCAATLRAATRPHAAPMPLWARGVMLGVLALLILFFIWGIRSTLSCGALAPPRGRYGSRPAPPPVTRENNPFSFWSYIASLLAAIAILLALAVIVVLGALQQHEGLAHQ